MTESEREAILDQAFASLKQKLGSGSEADRKAFAQAIAAGYATEAADEAFHKTAAELFGVLTFAYSDDGYGQNIEAFSKAVTLARKLVADDEELKLFGAHYERPGQWRRDGEAS